MKSNPLLHYGKILTERTGIARLMHRSKLLDAPVIVMSIPKSGTNLLQNVVTTIPGTYFVGGAGFPETLETVEERLALVQKSLFDLRPGCVYRGHIPYAPEIEQWLARHGIKPLFIYRDPRDYTVSITHYIMARPNHRLHRAFEQLGNHHDRVLGAIVGVGEGRTRYVSNEQSHASVKLMYDEFKGWIHSEHAFALRFEDLIGETRHHSDKAAQTIGQMLAFLNVPHDDSLVTHLLDAGLDPQKSGSNFRKGRSGSWQAEYSPEHIRAFHETADDLLAELGYGWQS